ncbi:sll1863 family stress response protein [Hydrogenovibrio thermophilus]|jgi:predicted  nucleic acid-binding Zn-ribbon protein|uniref:Coiled coil domain-containing protein n=1 Tax=Hydrogenovibrio thermophilus TaxID=265883 RepID=A0A410H597_9GAMM|nr:coiled coil domain-containing protein [Hydrogenovibrio thermophilus]QAB16095.1 coiled coil domain-containing protein [Hydrogenovibrio thermophilus]
MSTSNKQAYQAKLQAQLDEWSANIDALEAKARQADAQARIDLQAEIDTLKTYQHQAEAKLAELKTASDQAWQDLKQGIEQAHDNLKRALQTATDRF